MEGDPEAIRNDGVGITIAAMIVTLIEMLELTNEWLLGLLGSDWKSQDSFSLLDRI